MRITDLLTSKTIVLDAHANSKEEIIKKAIATIKLSGAIKNINEYTKLVFAREKKSTTGVGDGIAIPHAKSKNVKKPALAALIIKDGVDYDALDGEKVNLLFLIAAPDSKDNVHLDVLARLSNLLMHPEFKASLLKAKNATEFMNVINSSEELFLGERSESDKNKTGLPDYLAVTACPTGIAHTFMAEESLKKAAEKAKVSIKVETNGQAGVKNKLSDEEIKHAKGIILATDTAVETTRFDGKKVITTSVSKAIKSAEILLQQIDTAPIYKKKGGFIKTQAERDANDSKIHSIYRHLMNGISHMLPLVVGGGILIALSFLIDIGNSGASDFGKGNLGAWLFNTAGNFAFGLMLPILAGFIAHSIAGRPGLVVGLAGGVAANTPAFNLLYQLDKSIPEDKYASAGFLGAIIAGFLAGYIIKLLEKCTEKVPKSIDGLRPILIYPVFGVLMIGVSMFLLNVPFCYINIGFTAALNWLGEHQLTILLGGLLAAMMAADFGGPINKAAYVFGNGLLVEAAKETATAAFKTYAYQMMSSIMVGGMIPPLALGLSILLFPRKYSKTDRKNGLVTTIMGASFISEGVIPYAAADPLRVIGSSVVGALVGGSLSVVWKCELMAPHGGIFVIPIAKNIGWFILATIIGTVISAIMLGILKKDVNDELGKWKGVSMSRIAQGTVKFFKAIPGNVKKIFKKK